MKSIKTVFILLLLSSITFFSSCKKDKPLTPEELLKVQNDSIEKAYVVDSTFAIGDGRRYGLTPEKGRSAHPTQIKYNTLDAVINLSSITGMKITIPEGYYKMPFIIEGKKNVKLHFNNASFDLIQIIETKDSIKSENIELTGKLVSYASFGIVEAKKVKIDSLILKSNPELLESKSRNKGCHIYYGVNDLHIKYLEIEDLGSGDASYENAHAALSVDGWNNNPQSVTIDEVYIKSSDRHGVYLTGNDHNIGKITIDKFGVGSAAGMSGMQDAEAGQEKEFAGVWLNKCKNTNIGEVIINCKESKGKYSFKFEKGDMTEATTIQKLKIIGYKESLPIEYTPNTVVINETIKE